MRPAPPASPRVTSVLKRASVPLICLLFVVLGGCAHDAASSGASSDSAGSSDASSANSSASSDSSGSSAESSNASSGSSQDSSASTNGSSDSSQGTSDGLDGSVAGSEQSSDASSGNSSQDTTGTTLEGSSGSTGTGDPNHPINVAVSSAVAGSALMLSTAAGISFAIYGTVMAERRRQRPRIDPRTVALYLSAQAHQLEQDLALGAGPVLDDLGTAAGVSPVRLGRFGRVLQQHRVELLELARRDRLTPTRAMSFLERIGELTWGDPLLQSDAERLLLADAG